MLLLSAGGAPRPSEPQPSRKIAHFWPAQEPVVVIGRLRRSVIARFTAASSPRRPGRADGRAASLSSTRKWPSSGRNVSVGPDRDHGVIIVTEKTYGNIKEILCCRTRLHGRGSNRSMCVLMRPRVTEPNDQLRRLLLVLHSDETILDRVMASQIARIGAPHSSAGTGARSDARSRMLCPSSPELAPTNGVWKTSMAHSAARQTIYTLPASCRRTGS